MNKYLQTHPWKIVETHFFSERTKASESLFSIGNGTMGQRANFEETYSGKTLQGSYIGGVYYPDKTRVGWWKNGYPDYFAKVLNSANWIGIIIKINGETLDLHRAKVTDFYRELDMQRGLLTRRFTAVLQNGARVAVEAVRFVSMSHTELGAMSYTLQLLDAAADVEIVPYLDADVRNEDANYQEKFWDFVAQAAHSQSSYITMRTKKTNFSVCWYANYEFLINDQPAHVSFVPMEKNEWVGATATVRLQVGEKFTLHKYIGIASSLNHAERALHAAAQQVANEARKSGFAALATQQGDAWAAKWENCDVEIEGDDEAQQAIRYCIFQLLQTYTGEDARLNVGPKGFTGEKYGGSTYWDTEAYCLPFYLATAGGKVAKQLLVYRYNQLGKAVANATKLGFSGGAALYPMVTMNGEECHNEWEITFEEIHRNGAVAYAIYNYVRYTEDTDYLAEYGMEVLMAIARFWAQRISWSAARQRYVMLGVTGPNEYENNVNNNWYTNYIAHWCLRYAKESMEFVKNSAPKRYEEIIAKTAFDEQIEWPVWLDIVEKMYFPYDEKNQVFMQQDDYLDKEQMLAKDLDSAQRPLNQKWSWDRILRSCFIKQADVLQGIYFFENDFEADTIRRNFYFYEERTVHESSLSPCVHAILAAKIGDMEKAYEMYLRTARLDLDDYNNEVDEGLHITSMAGSWLSVVQGFAGMRVQHGKLMFNTQLPKHWKSLAFKVNFRGEIIHFKEQQAERT